MAAVSGKSGSVAVGGVNYPFGEWSAEFAGPLPDVTNFDSGGCVENVDSPHEATIDLEGPQSPGSMGLTRGVVYTFLLRTNSSVTFSVPARVERIKPSSKVKDAARVSVTAKSTGVFTPAMT